jgi:predicted 2-oxoglutarate/Fe(II)-dependent dioxygenase YbiX
LNRKLGDYLVAFKGAIPLYACQSVVQAIQHNDWQQHKFHNSLTKETIAKSGAQEFDMSHSLGESELQISNFLRDAFTKYLTALNLSWFTHLQAATHPRFNKYVLNRKMAEHCDHIHTIFDGNDRGIPILTALAILNDEYEGGELVFWQDTVIETGTGDIFVWPSLFLYPHRVEPVTKGERYSAVSWAW